METSTKVILLGGAVVGILALLKYKVFATPASSGGGSASTESESSEQGGGGMGGGTPMELNPNLSALNSQANIISPPVSTNTPPPASNEAILNTSALTPSPTPTISNSKRAVIDAGPATLQLGFNGKTVNPKTLKTLFSK